MLALFMVLGVVLVTGPIALLRGHKNLEEFVNDIYLQMTLHSIY